MKYFSNHSGTLQSIFQIGKKGPTINESTLAPSGGTNGDLWIKTTATQSLYQRISGIWQAFISSASGLVEPANVSATTLLQMFSTGDIKPSLAASQTGWVLADGRTIGNASSGATNRANADTVSLFTFLWTNLANTEAAVSGGRGASAAADFAANKTIALPDLRGRTLVAKDNMGGTAASRVTSAISGVDGTVVGKSGGDQRMQAHTHTVNTWANGAAALGLLGSVSFVNGNTSSTGAGASQNMQPSYVVNFMIKL